MKCTYCITMPMILIMYAPRRMLMYFGHRPAMSIPHETEFNTTEILLQTIVRENMMGPACLLNDGQSYRKLRSYHPESGEEDSGSGSRARSVVLLDCCQDENGIPHHLAAKNVIGRAGDDDADYGSNCNRQGRCNEL